MDKRRGLVDHIAAWLAAGLVGLYGLASFVGLFAPQPPNAIRDGVTGVIVFPAIASLYAAAAILQWEYGYLRRWQPALSGALTVAWVGGWSLWSALAVIGTFMTRGGAAARESFVYSLLLWGLFVALPWFIGRLRKRSSTKRRDRAFLDT